METAAPEVIAAADPQAEADQLKAQGNELFKAKEYLKAVPFYKKAIGKCPSAPLYSNLAAALLGVNKYAAALKEALKAVELDPSFERGIYRVGLSHAGLEHHDEAVEAFSRVLAVNAQNTEAQKKRALSTKKSIDAHKAAGTEPPQHVQEVWEALQVLKAEQAGAAAEAKELENLRATERAIKKAHEREIEKEEISQKTRDHSLVGAQYNNDNDSAVVETAMNFLRVPEMQRFSREQQLGFLVHKGIKEEHAKEAIARTYPDE